jgi:hypothetical protein
VEEWAGPDGLQEPLRGASAGLRPPVPAVQQPPGNHTEVVLMAVRAVIASCEGAHLSGPENGADGFGAVHTAPILLRGFIYVAVVNNFVVQICKGTKTNFL